MNDFPLQETSAPADAAGPLEIPALWQMAADMAADAHAGQTIRSTRIPYIAHPVRVAMILASVFGHAGDEALAAAYLHDTLEKTKLPQEKILGRFGPRVEQMVAMLSKNRNGPAKEYWQRLEGADWEIRLVKIADAFDHLDCPPDELSRRLKSAKKALALAFSDEPPIVRARAALKAAIRQRVLSAKE